MTIAQEHPVDAADNDPPRTLAELNSRITSSKPLVGSDTGCTGRGTDRRILRAARAGEQLRDQAEIGGHLPGRGSLVVIRETKRDIVLM